MGERLRSSVVTALVLILLVPLRAGAEEFSACWVATELDPWSGKIQQITRCRIVGGDVVDYASDSDVPSVLYPNTGTDLTGQCWYYTSATTQYIILAQYSDGDADIGFDPDPATPGGYVVLGPTLPRCTSEPTPASDPLADVWDYVNQYVHPPPTLDLNPRQGDGVTGLETFVGVPVPAPHNAQLSSGITTLEVFIEVTGVIVNWGDGTINSYPPTPEALSGYPDGWARHLYETKNQAGVQITVSYVWSAQWAVVGEPLEALGVPDTTTSVIYPIAEIVSVLQP